MTTVISEKTYKELNVLMGEMEAQISELNRRKEEFSAEIQKRKEQAVADFVLYSRQMVEAARLMVEMGIDPASISTEPFIEGMTEESSDVCEEEAGKEEAVTEHVSYEPDAPAPIKEVEPHLVDVIEVVETSKDTTVCDTSDEKEIPESKRLKQGVYTPFYYLGGIRTGAFPKNCILNKTRKSARLMTPFYKLAGNGPINKSLLLGNLKYRATFPNPDETRIYSSDGIAPTITAMHSNLYVWIGPEHHIHTRPSTRIEDDWLCMTA